MSDQLATIKQSFTDHIGASLAPEPGAAPEAPEQNHQQQEYEQFQQEAVPHAERPMRVEQEAEGDGYQEEYVPSVEDEVLEEQGHAEQEELEGDDETSVKLTQLEQENTELKEKLENNQRQEVEYRRKVNNLVSSTATLRTEIDSIRKEREYLANQAIEPLQRFQNIDLAQLTLEQRQQVNNEYMQAQQQAMYNKQQHDQFVQQSEERVSKAKQSEAEASLGVLQSLLPDWGEDRYKKAMDVAVSDYDFAPEYVEETTDWRIMKMWSDLADMKVKKQGGEKLIKSAGQQQKPPAPGRGSPVPMQRNAKGQYIKARDNAFQNPGNRSAFVDYLKARNNSSKR